MIHILNHQTDELVDFYSNKKKKFWDDVYFSSLENYASYYNFTTTYDNSQNILQRNRVLIQDEEGVYRELIIRESLKVGGNLQVFTIASYLDDLKKSKTIKPKTFQGVTVNAFLDEVLQGTGWKRGKTDYLGIATIPVENESFPFSVLKSGATVFGGELDFRIEVVGNKVIGRYVDLVERLGSWNGKEITVGKDLIGVTRRETSDNIVTALICYGPEREDGTRLEVLVRDEDARRRWGRPANNPQHLWDIYEPLSSDVEMTEQRLRSLGEQELKKRINSVVEYEADQVSIEHIFGFEHEKVRKGDTVRVKDTSYSPALYVEARVKAIKRSPSNPRTKTYTLGDFIEYAEEDIMAMFRGMQKVLAQKISESTLTERTYTKKEIDDKDESVYHEGTHYADVVSETAKTEAIETAAEDATQKANSAEQNAKDYSRAEIESSEQAILTNLDNRIGDVNADIALLSSQATTLESHINTVQGDLGNLQASVNQDISSLQSTANSLLLRANEQEADLLAASGRIVSIEQNIDTISGQMDTTITQLTALDGIVSEQQITLTSHAGLIEAKANQTTVDTLTGRVSTAEASIQTIAGQVSLKANSEDVYTKSEVNTELGKKVDTTVYSNKMSQLDLSINGITANVESIQSEVSDVDSRITTAQSQLDIQAGLISAKAERSELQEVDGKVTSVRNDLSSLEIAYDGISTSVSSLRSDLDGLEIGGRNLLRDTKERTLTAGTTNNFSYINFPFTPAKSGEQYVFRSKVEILIGNITHIDVLTRYSDGSGSRTFTAPIVDGEIKVEFNAREDEGRLYVYAGRAGATAGNSVKFIEIKLEKGSRPTDWTPAPEDVDGAISSVQQYASSIDQKADSIATSVSGLTQTVNGHTTQINNAQTQINQNTTAIGLKAEQSQVNTIAGQVSNLSTKTGELEVSVNGIAGRVTNTETNINELTGEVETAFSQIASLDIKADGINASVSEVRQDVDSLGNRVSSAESTLQVLPGQINAKASQTSVDSLTGRVDTAEGNINVLSGQLALKASSESVGDLETRMSSAEIVLDGLNSEISLKVDKDGIIGAINLSPETARIKAENIELVGAVTVLSDITGNLGTVDAGVINGVEINGSSFHSSSFHTNESPDENMRLENGRLHFSKYSTTTALLATAIYKPTGIEYNGSLNYPYFDIDAVISVNRRARFDGEVSIFNELMVQHPSGIKMKAISDLNAVHQEFVSFQDNRMGFIGFGSTSNNDLYISNEFGGDIRLSANVARLPALTRLEGTTMDATTGLSRMEFWNANLTTRWGRIGFLDSSNQILGIQNNVGTETRIYGNFSVSGSKAAVVDTKTYGARKMYAIEAPDNRFVAYEEYVLDVGEHIIFIEPMFLETISNFFVVPHVQNDSTVTMISRNKDSFRVMVSGKKAEVVFEINGKRLGFEHIYMEQSSSPKEVEEAIS